MSNLKLFDLVKCCAHETRSENLEYNLFTCAKAPFSHESHRSIQNLRAINMFDLRRKS